MISVCHHVEGDFIALHVPLMYSLFRHYQYRFIKLEAMDSDAAAASERILLEPYKYLLQLPGECVSVTVTDDCRVMGHVSHTNIKLTGHRKPHTV